MNETSVNGCLAKMLVNAELDEYRVANYQVTLLLVKSVGGKLRRISIVFDCNASVLPWNKAMQFAVLHDGEVTGRQKFLGDLFLLFGCPINEVATKADGSLFIRFGEERAIALQVGDEDLLVDDWVWRVEGEGGEGNNNAKSVSCVVVRANNHQGIEFLVK